MAFILSSYKTPNEKFCRFIRETISIADLLSINDIEISTSNNYIATVLPNLCAK